MIEVRDLHTYRGINYVLQGVSLDIQDGACTVLLGRNGMGKTTLVHTIMGLIRPRSGGITLDNKAQGNTARGTEYLVGRPPFQIVKGVHLRSGDYVWAAGPEPHGPYEYPEGCVVFASFRGLSAQHRYNGSPAGEI